MDDLEDPQAPHEPPAALRMQRNGWKGPELAEALNYQGADLMYVIQDALGAETEAHNRGAPMHDAVWPKDKGDGLCGHSVE